jgi:F0F1-type ATP synthase membrane subunit b/b'
MDSLAAIRKLTEDSNTSLDNALQEITEAKKMLEAIIDNLKK